jgi:hypothetical protein
MEGHFRFWAWLLGARLLSEVSKPGPGEQRRVVERSKLAGDREALQPGEIINPQLIAGRVSPAHRRLTRFLPRSQLLRIAENHPKNTLVLPNFRAPSDHPFNATDHPVERRSISCGSLVPLPEPAKRHPALQPTAQAEVDEGFGGGAAGMDRDPIFAAAYARQNRWR